MAWWWRRAGRPVRALLARRRRPAGGVPGVPRAARRSRHRGRSSRPGASCLDRHRDPARPPAAHGQLRRGRVGRLPAHRRTRWRGCREPGGCTSCSSRARSASSSGARDGGRLDGLEVSADFLGFRHYTVGAVRRDDARRRRRVRRLARRAGRRRGRRASARSRTRLGRLIVVTFGAQGVWAFDGRPGGEDAFVPVHRGPGCAGRRSAAATRSSPGSWRRGGDGATSGARSRRARSGRGGDGVAAAAPRRGVRRGGA